MLGFVIPASSQPNAKKRRENLTTFISHCIPLDHTLASVAQGVNGTEVECSKKALLALVGGARANASGRPGQLNGSGLGCAIIPDTRTDAQECQTVVSANPGNKNDRATALPVWVWQFDHLASSG